MYNVSAVTSGDLQSSSVASATGTASHTHDDSQLHNRIPRRNSSQSQSHAQDEQQQAPAQPQAQAPAITTSGSIAVSGSWTLCVPLCTLGALAAGCTVRGVAAVARFTVQVLVLLLLALERGLGRLATGTPHSEHAQAAGAQNAHGKHQMNKHHGQTADPRDSADTPST